MSSRLTDLKKRFERAMTLDGEIKQLEKFPPNPMHIEAYGETRAKAYLEEELLREVIREGVKSVLAYKTDEFTNLVNITITPSFNEETQTP